MCSMNRNIQLRKREIFFVGFIFLVDVDCCCSSSKYLLFALGFLFYELGIFVYFLKKNVISYVSLFFFKI